ncbi:MAG: hypothetical protein JSU66_00175 [Deltaproteobacteria bacterium]|nr:MAG: hypothetical protein JSU66_00175 [Deltaproteobacteria bacterium]
MNRAAATRPSRDSWLDRFFDRIPVAPVWVGAGLSLALIGLFLALVTATGDLARFLEGQEAWWEARDGRLGVLLALLAGYVVAARRYARLGVRSYLAELRAGLDWPRRDFEAAARDLEHLEPGRVRWAGLAGALMVPVLGLLVDRDPLVYFQPGHWGGANSWVWLVGAVAAWNGGCLFYAVVTYGRRFSSLAGRIPAIDLFDLTPLAPFARQGLRSALPGLILLSFFALNSLDRGFFWAVGLMGTLSLAAVTAALLLPMGGVRRRIRAVKQDELARVDAAIRGDASGLAESAIARRSGAVSIADLLAYRSFVQSVREWPFDAPTRLRMLLYLGIPVGSWLGGAFVERLLDQILG